MAKPLLLHGIKSQNNMNIFSKDGQDFASTGNQVTK